MYRALYRQDRLVQPDLCIILSILFFKPLVLFNEQLSKWNAESKEAGEELGKIYSCLLSNYFSIMHHRSMSLAQILLLDQG